MELCAPSGVGIYHLRPATASKKAKDGSDASSDLGHDGGIFGLPHSGTQASLLDTLLGINATLRSNRRYLRAHLRDRCLLPRARVRVGGRRYSPP